MMSTIYRFYYLLLFCLVQGLFSSKAFAQLPQCDRVYINFNGLPDIGSTSDSMYAYNPSLPVSATNPALNSIRLPASNSGLAISPVLGSGNRTLTYYTTVNVQYWFFDPATNAWVNTGHSAGPGSYVNIGAGGGVIYSMRAVGNFPNVYKYDGTGDATFVVNVSSPRPYDLVVDCEGNFYVLSLVGPMWSMTKYSPSGAILQGYTVNNPDNFSFSGGLSIIGNDFYADDQGSKGIAHGKITGTTLNFDNVTGPVPFVTAGHTMADFASCAPILGDLPTLSIATPVTDICTGTSVTLTGTVSHDDNPQYQWLKNGTPIPNATNSELTTIPADNDVFTLQMINNGACFNGVVTSNAITMHVKETPVISFRLLSTACAGDTIVVMADNPQNITYQWDFDGGEKLKGTGPGPYEIVWNTAGDHAVHLQAGENACISNATENILIKEQPSIEKPSGDHVVCIGDTIALTIQPGNMNSLKWLPGNHYQIIRTDDNTAFVVPSQNSEVAFKVSNDNGCSINDSIRVIATNACCTLTMPNAFTPNNDGHNDVFRPLGNTFQLKSFNIYNRWGQLIFHTTANNDAWNGTLNGRPLPIGTYIYLVEYHCMDGDQLMRQKGVVTLIR